MSEGFLTPFLITNFFIHMETEAPKCLVPSLLPNFSMVDSAEQVDGLTFEHTEANQEKIQVLLWLILESNPLR
mgnify:CR=1 FL=1